MRRGNASRYLTKLLRAARRLRGQWPNEDGFQGIPLAMIGDPDYRCLSRSVDVERNPALRAAFDAFGLDPARPDHWRRLCALFAEAHFVSHRGPGQHKKWGGEELCQLWADFAAVKQKHQDEDEEELRKRLRKDARYRRLTTGTIRRRLQDARNPKYNDILRDVLVAHKPDPRGMSFEQLYDFTLETIAKHWSNRKRR